MSKNKNKTKRTREELFERTPVFQAIMTLTIPMILGSLVSMLYNLADTYFVGMFNDAVQNSAVTLTAPAVTLFYAITNLFGIGASSLMSRRMGEKNLESVKKASATGIYFSLVSALGISLIAIVFNTPILHILGTTEETFEVTRQYLFWTVCLGAVPSIFNILLGYLLRAEGQSLQASIGTMSGCAVNILLDPFFILPSFMNMGAKGAALATFISNCIACLYFIVLLTVKRRTTLVSLNPRNVSFERDVIKNIFVVGFPGVVQNNLNVVSMTILNNLVALYGANAVASIGIANKINQLPIQIIFGFTQGVMPLIGYNYAAGNFDRMKKVIRQTFVITLSSLALVTLLFVFAGRPIVHIFMDNQEIAVTGGNFLRGFGLSLIFMCVDFMAVGISQAFGMGRHALIFSVLRKAAFEIPLILLLNHIFGLGGLAYGQCLAEVLMCIIAIFVLRKLLKDAGKLTRQHS